MLNRSSPACRPGPSADPRQANGHHQRFFDDFGVWKDSPVLKGTTKFEPIPGVKNIMVTGGAGFMYAPLTPA